MVIFWIIIAPPPPMKVGGSKLGLRGDPTFLLSGDIHFYLFQPENINGDTQKVVGRDTK